MDLQAALGGWPSGGNNNSQQQQPANSTWPGQPGGQPAGGGGWPGGQPGGQPGGGGGWPGQQQPATNPTWPGGQSAGPWPGQPANPTWPGQDGTNQPCRPGWPGQPGPAAGGGGGGGGAWPAPAAGGGGAWPGQPGHPSPGPGPGAGPGPGPGYHPTPQKMTVPYTQKLPEGVKDKLFTIVGTINPNADNITVDISTSEDIAFHFNLRFNDQKKGHKVIVVNSCTRGRWGKEERETKSFPFVQGQRFEMKILCTKDEYKVAVNNSHLLMYQHRVKDLKPIIRIGIFNDLTLSDVRVETLP